MNAKENNFNDVNDGNTPHLPLPKLHNTTPTSILATTIPDSWFQLISRVLDIGNKTIVQYGSFVGETRLEFYPDLATSTRHDPTFVLNPEHQPGRTPGGTTRRYEPG
jgi:hypothetical protein